MRIKSVVLGMALALVVPTSFAVGQEPAGANSPAAEKPAQDEDYYELLRLFADTLDQIDRNYVTEVSRRDLMEAAIKGMITKLDQHSNYIPPEELDRFRSGVDNEFGGVGIQIAIDDQKLVVISPLVNTPAYRAGILAGDHILKIDDTDTTDLTLNHAVKLLKGKVGTAVHVTVKHAHDESIEKLELQREIVQVETVLGDNRNRDASWDYFYDKEKKLGYVRIGAFGRHTAKDLRKAVAALVDGGMKGFVLDLRFNPGGLLSSAIEVSDLFISKGRIVSTEGRNAPSRTWDAHSQDTFEGFPMVVLVNRYSASASEIVAACLQDHDRAVVIGERTWGKGSVQNIIELEEGRSALKLTTAGYQRPSGKNIHRTEDAKPDDEWGVSPNDGYLVRLSPGEMDRLLRERRGKDIVRNPNDEAQPEPTKDDRQLDKALEYLNQALVPEKENADDKEKVDDKVIAETS